MLDGICYGKGIETTGSRIAVNHSFIETYHCEGRDFFPYVSLWFYARKDSTNAAPTRSSYIRELGKGRLVSEEQLRWILSVPPLDVSLPPYHVVRCKSLLGDF